MIRSAATLPPATPGDPTSPSLRWKTAGDDLAHAFRPYCRVPLCAVRHDAALAAAPAWLPRCRMCVRGANY
jgi:hypothetical protein